VKRAAKCTESVVVNSGNSEESSEEATEDTSNKAWRASEINNEERGDSMHVRQINIRKEWTGQTSVGVGGVRDGGRGQGHDGVAPV